MKLIDGLVIQKIADSYLLVPTGEGINVLNGAIKLNETSKIIYDYLNEGLDRENIVQELIKTYEINHEDGALYVEEVVNKLKEIGVLID